MSHKNVVKYCLLMCQCSIFGSGSANKVDPGGGSNGVNWDRVSFDPYTHLLIR